MNSIAKLPKIERLGLIEPRYRINNFRNEENNMGNSKEEFISKSKEGNFFDAFMAVVGDTVQLEIITIMEDEGNEGDIDPLLEITDKQHRTDYKGSPGKRMISTIALLDGDIQNIIGRQFVTDPTYEKLHDFHKEQVMKGEEIIKANLDSLHRSLIYAINIYKKSPKENTKTPPQVL